MKLLDSAGLLDKGDRIIDKKPNPYKKGTIIQFIEDNSVIMNYRIIVLWDDGNVGQTTFYHIDLERE